MNIVSLSEDEQGKKDGRMNRQKRRTRVSSLPSLPIDSVLIHIQLLPSQIALSHFKHTLVHENVFKCMFMCAKCWHFLWNRTQEKHFYCLRIQTAFICCLPFFFLKVNWVKTEWWQRVNHCISYTDGSPMLLAGLFWTWWRTHTTGTLRSTNSRNRKGVQSQASYNKV